MLELVHVLPMFPILTRTRHMYVCDMSRREGGGGGNGGERHDDWPNGAGWHSGRQLASPLGPAGRHDQCRRPLGGPTLGRNAPARLPCVPRRGKVAAALARRQAVEWR